MAFWNVTRGTRDQVPVVCQGYTAGKCSKAEQMILLAIAKGQLQLCRDHPYYTQCQLQMHVMKYAYCDFVVWQTSNIHIERLSLKSILTDIKRQKISSSSVSFQNCEGNGLHVIGINTSKQHCRRRCWELVFLPTAERWSIDWM